MSVYRETTEFMKNGVSPGFGTVFCSRTSGVTRRPFLDSSRTADRSDVGQATQLMRVCRH
jgi:hypothetical protein